MSFIQTREKSKIFYKKIIYNFYLSIVLRNEKNDKTLLFDFYLSEKRTCIECDGKQYYEAIEWFGEEESLQNNIKRDEIKNNYCKLNKIKLIRISRWEYNNIDKILTEELE